MTRLCYYISDHGFGHASRSIEIIRTIKKKYPSFQIFIKSNDDNKFIRNSLGNSINFFHSNNDAGICQYRDTIEVDVQETYKTVVKWINEWKKIKITEETDFCKKNEIDIIISDITPFPFLIADELNISSVAISNFNWYEIYKNMKIEKESIDFLRECYSLADLALILPFEDDMSIFKRKRKVNLVSRKITENKNSINEKLNRSEKIPLIFLSIGRSVSPSILKSFQILDKKYDYLVSYLSIIADNVFQIPSSETESQNYINACDIIVSKCGYGTVSEGINSKIPIILFKRPIKSSKGEFISEDIAISSIIKKYRIGFEVEFENLNHDILNEAFQNREEMLKNFENLPERYLKDGCTEICNFFQEFI
ncbi:MAG: hypothetical protein ACTSX4_08985 [Candidatus Helarchaeota archaeon]